MIMPNEIDGRSSCAPKNHKPTPAAPPDAGDSDSPKPSPVWKVQATVKVEIPIPMVDAADAVEAICQARELAADLELVVTLGGVPLRAIFVPGFPQSSSPPPT